MQTLSHLPADHILTLVAVGASMFVGAIVLGFGHFVGRGL